MARWRSSAPALGAWALSRLSSAAVARRDSAPRAPCTSIWAAVSTDNGSGTLGTCTQPLSSHASSGAASSAAAGVAPARRVMAGAFTEAAAGAIIRTMPLATAGSDAEPHSLRIVIGENNADLAITLGLLLDAEPARPRRR